MRLISSRSGSDLSPSAKAASKATASRARCSSAVIGSLLQGVRIDPAIVARPASDRLPDGGMRCNGARPVPPAISACHGARGTRTHDTPHPEPRGVVALSLLQPPTLTTVRPFARPCTKSSKAPGSASKSMVRVIAARWRGFRSVASRSQTRRRPGSGRRGSARSRSRRRDARGIAGSVRAADSGRAAKGQPMSMNGFRAGAVLMAGLVLAFAQDALAAPKIRIGTVPMAYTLHLDYLPQFAKDEALEVEVIDFKSSSDENQAIAAGSLDGGNVGALGANVLLTKGVPVVIVAGTVRGGSDFVVGKGVQTLRDLQGKKIGATKGSTSEILAKYQLKKAGIAATWINLPHPQLAVALSQQEVDAIAAGEPWAGLAVSRGIGKRLPGFDIYDSPAREISGALVLSQKLVRENPQAAQKLVNAFVKAVDRKSTRLNSSHHSISYA